MAKVYISCCTLRNPNWQCIAGFQTAIMEAAQADITCQMEPRQEALICRSRQNAVGQFLETDYTHLFFFDDDIELPKNAITKLLEANVGLIGGMYRLKTVNAVTAVRLPPDRHKNMSDILSEGLVEKAVYISTGCMMIRREVIEEMIREYPQLKYTANVIKKERYALFQPYVYKDEYLSEDWAFCQRAKDIGHEVWVDGSVQCGHWGQIKFAFER